LKKKGLVLADKENMPEKNQVYSQIKRNTILLVANNLLVYCISAFILAVSPIIIYDYTKSITLASLATSLILSVRILTNFPAGKLADNIGRKKTLLIGTALSLTGLFIMVASRLTQNNGLFWTGIITFGLSTGFSVLNRAAITDMYPKSSGRSLGYLNAGGFIGSILAPILVTIITGISSGLAILENTSYYDVVIFLCIPLLLATAFMLLAMPKDTIAIARLLKDNEPKNKEVTLQQTISTNHYRRNLAFALISSSIAVGGVSIALSLTPTLMHISNAELWIISFSMALISFGSNGLSIFSGMLSDKLGKKNIILMGSIIMGLGLSILPFTQNATTISISNFLIGFGGGATAIASTILICDLVTPEKRGKMFGLNSTIITIFTLFLPPLAATLFTFYHPFSVSILGLVMTGSSFVTTLFIFRKIK
jgi:MFS family permease